MSKKILITGGAGFIGGNFIHYILEKYPQYKVYNLDLLTYAGELNKHKHLEGSTNYQFIMADIADRAKIMEVFNTEAFDYVVHFAAESHVDRSIVDPELFIRTNVIGTQVLLDASRRFGISKFVHISTDEVYGDLDIDSPTLFTEETPLQPNSPYSASKASSDLLVRASFRTYDMPAVITRCSNNYGPYQIPEKLIPLTISKLLQNQTVPVYGDGKNVRDWLHVFDHCTAIDLVLHRGKIGEVYNIGGNNERNNMDVVKSIVQLLGKSEDSITFVKDRLGHDRRYAIDASKIRKLGWKPKYNFESGLEITVQWYIENNSR